MNQAAEKLLADVMIKYGSSACDTPQMFETLLRKYGRAYPQEVNVLNTALRLGIVSDLRTDKDVDPTALARVLALQGRLPQPQAEWAVTAWSAALAQAPAKGSTPQKEAPPVAGPMSPVRVAAVLAGAAATGVAAYLTFGH